MLRTKLCFLVTLLYVVLPSMAKHPDVYAIAVEPCESGRSECAKIQVVGQMEFYEDEAEQGPQFPDEEAEEDEDDRGDDEYQNNEENEVDEDDDDEDDQDDEEIEEDEDEEENTEGSDYYSDSYDEDNDDENEIPTLKKYTLFGADSSLKSKTAHMNNHVKQTRQHITNKKKTNMKLSKLDVEKVPVVLRRILGINSNIEGTGQHIIKKSKNIMKLTKIDEEKAPFILRRIKGLNKKA